MKSSVFSQKIAGKLRNPIDGFSLRLFVPAVLICLALLGLALAAPAQTRKASGWSWQNPRPQGNSLISIHFAPDKELGFAVGSDGTILRTENGGFDWSRVAAPIDTTLAGVFVRDAKRAVAVGVRGTILVTENAGKDWRQIVTDVRDHLSGVAFAGDGFRTGWVVGTYGRILKTDDGGATWKPQIAGTSEHFAGISVRSPESAVVTGQNGIAAVTKDGGASWKLSLPCGGTTINAASYVSDKRIVAVGASGCVAVSRDRGDTWERVNVYSQSEFLSLNFADEKNGSMSDSKGLVWLTGDGARRGCLSTSGRTRNSFRSSSPTASRVGPPATTD
ncbi:MAG: hypothetical protein IPK58_01435 [Acidobacteria bacterium]|nr:hypothetical protein [Acidobacteriota bacterium]